jgi:hypothetical protein
MCVDCTDFNKHCSKDTFGLPHIDQVIDSTAGCVLLCFLDCYSGYHQIALKEEDQIKTASITPYGAHVYITMSFGLKNASATYQRAIQLCFADQVQHNVEAYVDDVVIKTRNHDDFIADLEETFSSLSSSDGSSTRLNASLAYIWGNYSGSSSVIEELKSTRTKFPPSLTWGLQPQ